jgi:hypothetical protein
VVEREGFGTINEHGVDLRRVTSAGELSDYLCKVEGGWSAGHELARGDRKNGVTPFAMLGLLVETGEARWAALWREYERATFGRRAIVMSAGLRGELLGAEPERTDIDLASSEGADVTLLRALVSRAVWQRRWDEGTVGDLLTSIEHHAALLIVWSEALGVVVEPLDQGGQGWGPREGGSRAAAEPGGVPLTARKVVDASSNLDPDPSGRGPNCAVSVAASRSG